jgi:hypothetical protein
MMDPEGKIWRERFKSTHLKSQKISQGMWCPRYTSSPINAHENYAKGCTHLRGCKLNQLEQ